MEMRKILAAMAYKYDGLSEGILNSLDRREVFSDAQIENFENVYNYKYVTLIDKEYPKYLKNVNNPPIVLFYKGDLNLINGDNDIIAKATSEGVRMVHVVDPIFTDKGIKLNYVMACENHDDMDMLMEHAMQSMATLEACTNIALNRNKEKYAEER